MVVVAAPAVKLTTCWPKPVAAAKRRNTLNRTAPFSVVFDLKSLIRIIVVASRSLRPGNKKPSSVFRRPACGRRLPRQTPGLPYSDSSIGNSRESTSNIISMPPGKTLLVVISRSLCECHINAQPRSLAGLAWLFEGSRDVQFALTVVSQLANDPRRLASGPRYGEPPYHWPFVNTFGSGNVTGPPAATSPNGATWTGLLWSWHHS